MEYAHPGSRRLEHGLFWWYSFAPGHPAHSDSVRILLILLISGGTICSAQGGFCDFCTAPCFLARDARTNRNLIEIVKTTKRLVSAHTTSLRTSRCRRS